MRYALFCLFLITLSFPAAAEIRTSAEQAYVMDYDTGMILMQKNSTERMPTSSMSKVMTMIYVFQALKQGQLSLDDKLPVSEKAWRKGGSKMFVEVGKNVKVEDLIRGVIVQSGNDATIVLAEGLAGTEEDFAREITKMAGRIGMENSSFINASGWPDPKHFSTAEDLAVMAEYLIRNFPEYYDYYSETEFTYNNIKQINRNPLLYQDIGADGVKTGHTEAGGYGLIGSAKKNGRRVILVLNGMDSAEERAQEATRLMQWALNNFVNQTFFESGRKVTEAEVRLGRQAKINLAVPQDVKLTVPHSVAGTISAEAVYESPLIAPIETGQRVGTLKIKIPGYRQLERPLIAGESIPELGFFGRTLARAQIFFAKLF